MKTIIMKPLGICTGNDCLDETMLLLNTLSSADNNIAVLGFKHYGATDIQYLRMYTYYNNISVDDLYTPIPEQGFTLTNKDNIKFNTCVIDGSSSVMIYCEMELNNVLNILEVVKDKIDAILDENHDINKKHSFYIERLLTGDTQYINSFDILRQDYQNYIVGGLEPTPNIYYLSKTKSSNIDANLYEFLLDIDKEYCIYDYTYTRTKLTDPSKVSNNKTITEYKWSIYKV